MEKRTYKIYPQVCLSATCGKIDCTGCPYKDKLDKFNQWVKEHEAIVTNPIWCPTVYVAMK